MEPLKLFTIIAVCLYCVHNADSYFAELRNNGPVVLGANITFTAHLYASTGEPPSGTFRFEWRDNAIPSHSSKTEGESTSSQWVVAYPSDQYSPGQYEVEVSVYKVVVIDWPLTSLRAYFNLTTMLNGAMSLHQNTTMNTGFVTSTQPVEHRIDLNEADMAFLTQKATSVETYWFVDCVYYGQSSDYRFSTNYSVPMSVHNVEALVVASYEPITTPAPETTTTTPTTTTTSPTTTTPTTTTAPSNKTTPTTTATTTSPAPTTTTTLKPHLATAAERFALKNESVHLPFVCLNSSSIPPDPKKTYGYFHQQFQVKAPVSDIKIEGSDWLQREDVLNLVVSWSGSPSFSWCVLYTSGHYNSTGNETCSSAATISDNSSFSFTHFFYEKGEYTLLIIVHNSVSHTVRPVLVTVYEATPQAQLSVIVVPVACSLLAVILVVFGIAYFIQSRNRYTVEVADFNFGATENMEYKTFRERLLEAVQGNKYSCPDFSRNGEDYGRMSN